MLNAHVRLILWLLGVATSILQETELLMDRFLSAGMSEIQEEKTVEVEKILLQTLKRRKENSVYVYYKTSTWLTS